MTMIRTVSPPPLGRLALFAAAAASGIAVANIYYNQPMLGLIQADFPGDTAVGLIPTATQLGYALGLFLLLPLGDLISRRRLIISQFAILAVALVLAAIAPTAASLAVASLLVGAAASVAQQIVPFVASLALPERRGATIGTVMAGLLAGILLSRTLSGFIGEHAGWRDMFWIGVPMALIAAGMMAEALPHQTPASTLRYPQAIASLAGLWKSEPELRTATLLQATLFASFSVFWTILALYLKGPQFNLGADIAGLFGVIGAAGIVAAPLSGWIADRRGPHFVVWLGAFLALLAWAVFGIGANSLIALVAGTIILDIGLQGALISNQHIIYALAPEARSRINTIFMTGMFLGGAAGSALANLAWSAGGWPAVSILGATLALLSIGLKAFRSRMRSSALSGH